MIASSSTVLSNLAYLIGAVVVAFIGGILVWLHHRQPKSVDANMASFRRGLSALAPDPTTGAGPERRPRVRPGPTGLTHVRVEVRRTDTADGGTSPGAGHDQSAAAEAAEDRTGGQSG